MKSSASEPLGLRSSNQLNRQYVSVAVVWASKLDVKLENLAMREVQFSLCNQIRRNFSSWISIVYHMNKEPLLLMLLLF